MCDESSGSYVEITRGECDSCHREGPVALHHLRGTPIYAECQGCGPKVFEAEARRSVDRWLAGEPVWLGSQMTKGDVTVAQARRSGFRVVDVQLTSFELTASDFLGLPL